MNQHGHAAKTWWQNHRPQALNNMSQNQQTDFFSTLGEQVSSAIDTLTDQLQNQHPTPQHQPYLQRVAHLTTLQRQAQDLAYEALVWVNPEETENDLPNDNQTPQMDNAGMPTDPTHPLWQMRDDPNVSIEDFRQAHQNWTTTLDPADQKAE